MSEVKPQAIRSNQRSLLADMVPKNSSKSGVKQMGGGVITADRFSTLGFDRRHRGLAGEDVAGEFTPV
jgi:hypothetical protein